MSRVFWNTTVLVIHAMRFLTPADLRRVSCVSRRMRNLVTDDTGTDAILWRPLCLKLDCVAADARRLSLVARDRMVCALACDEARAVAYVARICNTTIAAVDANNNHRTDRDIAPGRDGFRHGLHIDEAKQPFRSTYQRRVENWPVLCDNLEHRGVICLVVGFCCPNLGPVCEIEYHQMFCGGSVHDKAVPYCCGAGDLRPGFCKHGSVIVVDGVATMPQLEAVPSGQ